MSYDPFAHPVPPHPAGQKTSDGRTVTIIVLAVVAVAILVAGVVGTVWMFNRDEGGAVAAASPSPTAEPHRGSAHPSPTPEGDHDAVSSSPPVEVDQEALARAEALGFSPVAYEMGIEEIADYYSEQQTSLELFEDLIPATEEGAEYVYAFMLVIADHKSAGMFGSAFEGESRDEFAAIELQFLTVSDMDVNIKITQSDGSVFEHDGTAPTPDPAP